MTTSPAPAAVDAAINAICDKLRRSNCAGAMQYVPELTWILFLRILDAWENREAAQRAALGLPFTPSLEYPYRWRDWAAPAGKDSPAGKKRQELQEGALGAVFAFVREDLLPHLRGLKDRPGATVRQQIVSEIMAGVEQTRVDTERNFLDVLDAVDAIRPAGDDLRENATLSQAYEGLLLKMGEKNNDGGQFFTPREVIKAIVETVQPAFGETVFDPGCGTGGFLAQAYHYMRKSLGDDATGEQLTQLATQTFYGREKENLIYPIALANLALNGIDRPNLWHGNTLTGNESYGGLFREAPPLYDVVMMNPPFGGKEGPEAQTRYAYKSSATQVLFLQEVVNSLKPGGRAGIVVDEGLLFRANENAFVQVKEWLLDECDVYCIVSLAPGVFTSAGAGVKTNLMFFTKGQPTEKIWYYELYPPPWRDRRTGQMRPGTRFTIKYPITRAHFDDFFELLPRRADSPHSWTVSRAEIAARNYDLKALNPNRREQGDTRTPAELLAAIGERSQDLQAALAELWGM